MLWQRQRLEPMTDAEREAQQSYVPISEIVEVPKEYELAMEAALGSSLTDDSQFKYRIGCGCGFLP